MADGIIDPGAVYSQRYGINMNEQVPLSLLINKLIMGNAKLEMTPTQTAVGDKESPVFETTMTPTIGGLPATKNADGTYSVQVGDRTHGGYATVPISVNPQTGVAQLTRPDAITYSPGSDVSFGGFLKQAALPIAAVVAAAYLGPEILSAFGAETATTTALPGALGATGMGGTALGTTGAAMTAADFAPVVANALAPVTAAEMGLPALAAGGAAGATALGAGGAAAPATLASGLPAAGTTIPAAAGATAPVSGALGTGLYDAGLGNIADAGITGSAFTPASAVNAPLAAIPAVATGALGAGMGGAATDMAGNIIGAGTAAEGAAAMGAGGPDLSGLSLAGQAAGKVLSGIGAGKQADIISGGTKEALQNVKDILQPRITAGMQGVNALAAGLAPGGAYSTPFSQTAPFSMADALTSPAMQEAQRAGQDIIQTGAAARGGLLGSNTLTGLQKFGQANAAQYEQQAFNQWLQQRQQAYNQWAQDRQNQINAQLALANIGAAPTQSLATVAGGAPLAAAGAQSQATGAKYDIAGNLISNVSTGLDALKKASDLFA